MKTVLIVMVCALCVGVFFTACPKPETADTSKPVPSPETPETPKPATQKQVTAGETYTVAMDAKGTLYAWGKNDYGQLGTGDTENRLTPTKLANPSGVTAWKQVSAGYFHTVAIAQDSTLYAWGDNGNGQLGNGKGGLHKKETTPTKLANPIGVTAWKQVAAGSMHTVAIDQDDMLYAWGDNHDGQLGNGNGGLHEKETTPTRVTNPIGVTKWKQVSAGLSHTMAIAQDGTLYAWGQNRYKQLGTGDTKNRLTPTKIGDKTWKQVDAGMTHTSAIAQNGILYAWGWSFLGGLWSNMDGPKPIGKAGKTWRQVVAGKRYMVTIDTDDVLYEWSRGYAYTPTPMGEKDKKWKRVAAGWLHAVAIDQEDALYTWGANNDGQLGTGNTKNSPTPTRISLE